MIIGVIKDGRKIKIEHCVREVGALAELQCPEVWTHWSFVKQKIPSVTSIVTYRRLCPAKVWYDYNYEIYVPVEALYSRQRGTVMHRGLFAGRVREMTLYARTAGVLWGGMIDMYDPERCIIYDVKTSFRLRDEPSEHHYEQLQFYTLLCNENNICVNAVIIAYLTYYDWQQFEIPADVILADAKTKLERALEHWERVVAEPIGYVLTPLARTILKEPGVTVQEWVCFYCDYWRWCDEGKKIIRIADPRKRRLLSPPSAREDEPVISIEEALRRET